MKKNAFTLIELLLAVSILGLVSTVVGVILSAGISGWKVAAEKSDTWQDGDAVMEQVVMALRSAYYPSTGELPEDYGFWHENNGEEADALDTISWVKIGSALIGEDTPWAGSAHRVKLFVNDQDGEYDGPGLYVSAWQTVGLPEDFDPDEDVIPLLLSDQVVGMDVLMRDPAKVVEVGAPYEMLEEWSSSNRIPTHLQIQLSLKNPLDERADPDPFIRMVEIPMSMMSWTPKNFSSGEAGKQNNRSKRHTSSSPSGTGRGDRNNRGSRGNNMEPAAPGSGGRPNVPGATGGGNRPNGNRGNGGGNRGNGGFQIESISTGRRSR